MSSLLSFILYYVIAAVFFLFRRKSSDEIVDWIRDGYEAQNLPESVPSLVADDTSITTGECYFQSQRTDSQWQILTATPAEDKGEKVLVYFHGGGFVRAGTIAEWMLQKDVLQLGIPTIYPVWTVAPYSTAIEFAEVAVELIISIAEDPQYRGREIILSGGSAGGWGALRSLLALCEAALGEDGADDPKRQIGARAALARTKNLALFSPAVNLEVTDELVKAGKADPCLSPTFISVISTLWSYGATELPSIFETMSPDAKQKTIAVGHATADIELADPRFSPGNGIDVLRRYHHAYPNESLFSILTFHGTADILYPKVKEMHDALRSMGRDVIQEELVSAKGMWHSYMFYPKIREGREAMARFRRFVKAA